MYVKESVRFSFFPPSAFWQATAAKLFMAPLVPCTSDPLPLLINIIINLVWEKHHTNEIPDLYVCGNIRGEDDSCVNYFFCANPGICNMTENIYLFYIYLYLFALLLVVVKSSETSTSLIKTLLWYFKKGHTSYYFTYKINTVSAPLYLTNSTPY